MNLLNIYFEYSSGADPEILHGRWLKGIHSKLLVTAVHVVRSKFYNIWYRVDTAHAHLNFFQILAKNWTGKSVQQQINFVWPYGSCLHAQ